MKQAKGWKAYVSKILAEACLAAREGTNNSEGTWVNLRNAVVRWLRRHLNLYRAWYLYGGALGVFLVFSWFYPDPLLLQLSAVFFPILALYLIMVTSNRELQRATKLQVDSFVSELRLVGSELRNVTSKLENVAATLQGLKQVMERQITTQETITAIEQAETAMRASRMKPVLYVKAQLTGWNLLIDLRQHQLLIYNSGGDAREVFAWAAVTPMQDGLIRFGPWAIATNKQVLQSIGPSNAFGGATVLFVSISCRDVERREYRGVVQVSLGSDWSEVPLAASQ